MLQLIKHEAIHELRLARPPVNALDPALVRTLREALAQAQLDVRTKLLVNAEVWCVREHVPVVAVQPVAEAEGSARGQHEV